MGSKEESSKVDRFDGKVIPIPINQMGYLPIFPDGFCVGARVSKDKKEIYIILRFYVIENEMRIPVGTYILPIGIARKLMGAIRDSIERTEKEVSKEYKNEK